MAEDATQPETPSLTEGQTTGCGVPLIAFGIVVATFVVVGFISQRFLSGASTQLRSTFEPKALAFAEAAANGDASSLASVYSATLKEGFEPPKFQDQIREFTGGFKSAEMRQLHANSDKPPKVIVLVAIKGKTGSALVSLVYDNVTAEAKIADGIATAEQ